MVNGADCLNYRRLGLPWLQQLHFCLLVASAAPWQQQLRCLQQLPWHQHLRWLQQQSLLHLQYYIQQQPKLQLQPVFLQLRDHQLLLGSSSCLGISICLGISSCLVYQPHLLLQQIKFITVAAMPTAGGQWS